MKILIIGFGRSGTTMVWRLFQFHPHVKFMFGENNILTSFHQKETLHDTTAVDSIHINWDLQQDTWGEKVAYISPTILNRGKFTPLQYCEKWNDFFEDESRILHICRHPLDVWNSFIQHREKLVSKEKIIEELTPEQHLDNLFGCVRDIVPQLKTIPNLLAFKYEDLVGNPTSTYKSRDIYTGKGLTLIGYSHINEQVLMYQVEISQV